MLTAKATFWGQISPCPAKEIVLDVSGALSVQVLRILAQNNREKDSAKTHQGFAQTGIWPTCEQLGTDETFDSATRLLGAK